MKKFKNILFGIIFILIPYINYGQWYPQESGITTPLNSLYFYDNLIGCAAGFYANYIKTTNGGEDWVTVNNGTEEYLWDVFILNPAKFWAVGQSNASFYADGIILSNSGSSAWYQQYTLPMGALYAIIFTDEETGWTVGGIHDEENFFGVVLKTEDDGASWFQQYIYPDNYFYAIDFVDDQVGWVAGSGGVILTTTNGGTDWEQQVSGTDYFLKSICFINHQTGWIAGTHFTSFDSVSIILHTIDGGDTWETQYIDSTFLMNEIDIVNPATGWVVGSNGIILNTLDGGETWVQQPSGTIENLRSVCFTDSLNGWMLAGSYDILHTANGGGIYTSVIQNKEKNHITQFICSPNPFSTKITVDYELQYSSNIQLSIYNHLGEKVMILVNKHQVKSKHKVTVNGTDLPAGIYFCVLKTSEGVQTKKMIKL